MKKILFFSLLLISISTFSQTNPKVILKDSSQLKLKSLKVNIKIVGNWATTTYSMKFFNELERTLEGELKFPLGQGQSVSEFAMDLNGKLRKAVIVEKELARVAYETTVRQNIDPALLEKTSGNNYKARVYPILPKKLKHVVITYEERLTNFNNKLAYKLPLEIEEIIDEFSINISVFGNSKKAIITHNTYEGLRFIKKEGRTTASISLRNIKPKIPVQFEIETLQNATEVLTKKDYFYAHIPLKAESRNKKKPKKIDILWDISHSMSNRNIEKELKLLNEYFKYIQNVEVIFTTFNNEVNKSSSFSVSNGNWNTLKKEIQSQVYDGGTNLETFNNLRFKSDEILLFSDGLSNLGNHTKFFKKPIYTINSLTSANHFSLERIATNTGGVYINLGRLTIKKAIGLLVKESLQYLGVKQNSSIEEVYPKNRVTIIGDFVLAGQYKSNTSIEVQFGYQGKVTKTKKLNIDNSKKSDLVKRLWAKQKLDYLNQNKEQNKLQIISLAKQHHLITDYTSMLILDRIEDYVRYRIEPPKELRTRYKELLKEKDEDHINTGEDLEFRKESLFENYKNILDWHQSIIKINKEKKIATRNRRNTDSITNNQNTEIDYSKRVITGTVEDIDGTLPGVNITVKGTMRGAETDFDGKYIINVDENDILVFSYLGYETKEIQVNRNNNIDVMLKEGGEVLEEIVAVSAYSMKRSASTSSSVVKLSQGKISIRGISSISNTKPLYIVDGISVNGNPLSILKPEDIDNIQSIKSSSASKIYGNRAPNGVIIITTKAGKKINKQAIDELNTKIEETIELKAWDPKTPYLDILQKEPSVESAYIKYLKIRDQYSNSPMFYIDVADFFNTKGAQELAIRILTNLIEIDLDNYELIKALAYKLEYFKQYDLAKKVYKKVLDLRPEEPQSYRDLALAYELTGDYQDCFNLLYKIYSGQLLEKDIEERFDGIESIVFIELTRLVSKYGNKLKLNKHQKSFFKPIPLDLRIVVDWNHNDTDIDLWVIDPLGEKAYYNNQKTKIGGRMSNDMTSGYGPEEFMLKKAISGKYEVMIDYYADNIQKISGPTILKVTMFTNYGKKNEKKETTIVRLDKQEDSIEIGTLNFK